MTLVSDEIACIASSWFIKKKHFQNKSTSLNFFFLYNSCIQTFHAMWDNSYKTFQITDASYNPKIFNMQSIYQWRRSRSEMDLVVEVMPLRPLKTDLIHGQDALLALSRLHFSMEFYEIYTKGYYYQYLGQVRKSALVNYFCGSYAL